MGCPVDGAILLHFFEHPVYRITQGNVVFAKTNTIELFSKIITKHYKYIRSLCNGIAGDHLIHYDCVDEAGFKVLKGKLIISVRGQFFQGVDDLGVRRDPFLA